MGVQALTPFITFEQDMNMMTPMPGMQAPPQLPSQASPQAGLALQQRLSRTRPQGFPGQGQSPDQPHIMERFQQAMQGMQGPRF